MPLSVFAPIKILGRLPKVSAKKNLLRIRFALYGAILLLLGYAFWRFELTSLPAAGCSPLDNIPPGSDLWIDMHPAQLHIGDDVLFRHADSERLLLGRIRNAPAVLPEAAQAALDAGALWISGDNNDCDARDSRLFGPIDPKLVAGRILFSY